MKTSHLTYLTTLLITRSTWRQMVRDDVEESSRV